MSLTTSAELVTHDDILKQIVFRLPVRSLVGFKCVSKHWQSLISSHLLYRNHNPKLISPYGLFIRRINHTKPEFAFVSFDRVKPGKPPLKSFDFVKFDKGFLKPGASGIIKVVQSCNGLLLCRTLTKNYYVYNPTTNQFTTIPKHDKDDLFSDPRGMTLVFDPLKSPYYKLVCVCLCGRIHVYSSENRIWMAPSNKLLIHMDERLDFVAGVYCNGAVHWDGSEDVIYYKMDKKNKNCIYRIALPKYVFNQSRYNRRRCYPLLVESHDSLLFIDVFHSCVEVDIYEMHRDYYGWFKLYHVNLSVIISQGDIISYTDFYVKHRNSYVVHCFVPRVGEEEAFLVIETPDDVIMRYNLESKTCQKLCDLDSSTPGESWTERYDRGLRSFVFIESLARV
ncbi:F-box protein At5g07610-like [Rutidosis leptorrhynchoides]|uniref:F-box protein At5g07610-like n=1 Tax=Rutidosis leptorrhynchoides TaxID=125765 RepID=UPI003A9A0380